MSPIWQLLLVFIANTNLVLTKMDLEMSKDRIRYLFFRHYEKTASTDERSELMDLVRSGHYHDQLKLLIQESLQKEQGANGLSEQAAEQILSSIIGKDVKPFVEFPNPVDESADQSQSFEKYKSTNLSWLAKVAAAVVLLVVSFIGYNFWNKNRDEKSMPASMAELAGDFPPGKDKAYLSLADGTNVDLESAGNESILGRMGISNDPDKGELTYSKIHSTSGFNTLRTPLGGQYKLVLPDGSLAWLNAGSSLKFPNSFEKNVRRVEMSGEVYFEIASDASKPFIVTVISATDHKKTEVKVLGTHFNISSYSDEPQIKTTLLEGSVEVKREGVLKRLKPGQQARIHQRSGQADISVRNVKASSSIAWKEGRFEFNDNIKEIMRQISRWYDVRIEYEGNVGEMSFAGAIPRKKNVSEVLKMLELTGRIRFEVKDRTIIVKAAAI